MRVQIWSWRPALSNRVYFCHESLKVELKKEIFQRRPFISRIFGIFWSVNPPPSSQSVRKLLLASVQPFPSPPPPPPVRPSVWSSFQSESVVVVVVVTSNQNRIRLVKYFDWLESTLSKTRLDQRKRPPQEEWKACLPEKVVVDFSAR